MGREGTDCTGPRLQRNAVDASSPKALDSLNAEAPPAVANGSAPPAAGEPQLEKPLGAGGAAAANGSGLGGIEPVLGGTSFSGGFSKANAAAVAPPMPDEKPYEGEAGVLGAV